MLCTWHHKYSPDLSAHEGQLGFIEWLEENMPEKLEYIRKNRYRSEKPNYREAYLTLKSILEEI
jgi:hypothetical protein